MKASCKNISSEKKSESYRFKRWTGKVWAVFNSLKRHIELGFLSIAISAALGVKSALMNSPDSIYRRLYGSEDKDHLAAPDDLYLALLCSLLVMLGQIPDVADAAFSGSSYISLEFSFIANSPQVLLLLFFSFFTLILKRSMRDMISPRYHEVRRYLTTIHHTTTDS